MEKPVFNTALGALNWTLQPNLPARFTGVTARVFPLKARMDVLRAFCGSYLNVADKVVQFQPILPYVYLMILNYGRMSPELENLGWVAQHEVAFAVPLAWYRIDNGRPVYVDTATVCPFIFVDNELSLSTGREVYGWPKVKAWLDPSVSPWLDDPRYDMNLLSLGTMLYPELFAGQRAQPEVLLQIRQRPLPSFSQLPFDLANPLGALMRLPTAMVNWLGLLGQLFETASRMPLLGYGDSPGLLPLPQLLRQGWRSLDPFSSPAPLNLITLKQFRDAEYPAHACYQAIVNSEIRTLRFNAGGLLGEANLLSGDPSGGFEILVHRYGAQPIVESLGLDVSRETAVGATEIAVLSPVLPFWVDVDLEYGTGGALCWRTRNSPWQTDAGPVPEEPQASLVGEIDGQRGHPFNTTLGAALQDVAGPFDFPNATVRVLPLLADGAKLEHLCNEYLNKEVGDHIYHFEPWGSCVYLVVTNFGEMSAPKANMGFWADREVTFFIPVKWYDNGNPRKLLSVALVPIFGFADSGTGAITSREVNGRPTLTAAIKSPPNSWLAESGPSEGENEWLMTLESTVFPALTLGQRAEWRTLLEIVGFDPLRYNDDVRWRPVADSWGQDLLKDHRSKIARKRDRRREFEDARALAIEILANRQPINFLTLKQFRDVKEPLCACYQALVVGRREVNVAYDMREIENPLHVGIHRYPSLPLVEQLGLQVKCTTTGAQVVDYLQPIRPFWARVALKEHLGETLCWRADETWVLGTPKEPFYFAEQQPADVGPLLVGAIDTIEKQRLTAAVNLWRRDVEQEGGLSRLSRAAAAAAVESIEPQMIIDSVLSKEWLNWGNPRWYQGLREKPDFCVPLHSIGEKTTREALFGEKRETRELLFGKRKEEWPWPGWYSEDTEA